MAHLRKVDQHPVLHGNLRLAIEPILREHGYTINQLIAETSAYTPTNFSTDRSFNAGTATLGEIANVLATLITDLQGKDILT